MNFYGYDYIAIFMLNVVMLFVYFVRRKVIINKLFLSMILLNSLYALVLLFVHFNNVNHLNINDTVLIILKKGLPCLELLLMGTIDIYLFREYIIKKKKLFATLVKTVFILIVLDFVVILAPAHKLFNTTDIFTVKNINGIVHFSVLLILVYINLAYINIVKKRYSSLTIILVFILFSISLIFIFLELDTGYFSLICLILFGYIYINKENPSIYISSVYNTFNKNGANKIATNEKLKKTTTFVLTNLAGVEFVLTTKKEISGSIIVRDILEQEKKYYGFKNIFYLGNGNFLTRVYNYNEELFIKRSIRLCNEMLKKNNCGICAYPSFSKLRVKQGQTVYKDALSEFINVFEYASNNIGRYKMVDYNTKLLVDYKREKDIVDLIKKGLVNNKFEVYFQPIYNSVNSTFDGAEALIRLRDTSLGFVGPDEFIPIAEKAGLIFDIDTFVIKSVINFLSTKGKRLNITYIDVNFSHLEAASEKFVKNFIYMVENSGLDPKQIHVEITETTSEGSEEDISSNLKILKSLGYILCLDDYGSGFASIDYLVSFDFDIIKIDKSILLEMEKNPLIIVLLQKISLLALDLDKRLVAEGVESRSQTEILLDLKVNYFQGYYYSRPLCQSDFIQFIESEEEKNAK